MSPNSAPDQSTLLVTPDSRPTKGRGVWPVLTICSHPDATRVGERLFLNEVTAGATVAVSRFTPDFSAPRSVLGQSLADPYVSRKPLLFSRGESDAIRVEIPADAKAAMGTHVSGTVDLPAEALVEGVPLVLGNRVVLLLHRARSPLDETDKEETNYGMIGRSDSISDVRRAIANVGNLTVPVLIRGESGTGKELVAQALHNLSGRSGPFVSVNLGAVPPDLAAAELFGARKGAYTGADRDRHGFFGAARGGTIFLDEIGEAPAEVQVMLLRVLETGQAYPVGGNVPYEVDARVIAATDANLEELIDQRRFRLALYHRLNGYEIPVLPLRKRREDIGLLLYHFMLEEMAATGESRKLCPEDPMSDAWLPGSIAARLIQFDWPGNVRQLRNVARQLVIGSRGRCSVDPDIPILREIPPLGALPSIRTTPQPSGRKKRRAADIEVAELETALAAALWDYQAAADRLGIARASLYDLMSRYQLRRAGDLSPEEIRTCHAEMQGDLNAMVSALRVSGQALKRRARELGLVVVEK
ncbi:MAG: sigma-54-dependent Fis family transcriptional regulator [Polyangiaceae bacterium]|nr:sigma-54-dependent Fis family transcriptional regulator [Polyangiaceae bacterium]